MIGATGRSGRKILGSAKAHLTEVAVVVAVFIDVHRGGVLRRTISVWNMGREVVKLHTFLIRGPIRIIPIGELCMYPVIARIVYPIVPKIVQIYPRGILKGLFEGVRVVVAKCVGGNELFYRMAEKAIA